MCDIDVLGLKDPTTESEFDHEEFKKQIIQNKEGQYTTRLPWKPDQVQLPDNKTLSFVRLQSTTKKLERMGKLTDYDNIMQEQLSMGMIEPAPKESNQAKVHYIPHHAVIKEESQTTPLRIVYDCSAKSNNTTPSLNECLETGPPLQPHLFDVLLRNRFRKFVITGDIKKAFHQIHLPPEDRDVQRVLWYNNLQDRKVMEYRFTRVIFGATSSPYILGATIEKHLEQYGGESCRETIKSLKEDTYVDDVQGGGDDIEDVRKFKEEATMLLKKGGFQLYKWHSNVKEFDAETNSNKLIKILGIEWNKKHDTMSVTAGIKPTEVLTKRKVLSAINSVFDVLGWASPLMVTAKLIFSEICNQGFHWDVKLPEEIQTKWDKWVHALASHNRVIVPRTICTTSGGSTFQLHGFADASKHAVCAAIYAVEISKGRAVAQNLLVAKSRIAPKATSIPRLELIAAHTLSKLSHNIRKALKDAPITEHHYWSDSTTVLHWLVNQGKWTVFVRNRVQKIKELSEGNWKHVPTAENPADLGTRAILPTKLGDLWLKGPEWLTISENEPVQPDIIATSEALSEITKKKEKSMMTTTDQQSNERKVFVEKMTQRCNYWKLLRVTAWINRFQNNCSNKKQEGSLTTDEINIAETKWIKLIQGLDIIDGKVDTKEDEDGIRRVNSRIPGYQPILLSQKGEFIRRLIEHYHLRTLHGGVQSTMVKIRERFWIPKLRTLVKSFVHRCNLCKTFRIERLKPPATSDLPEFRAEFTRPFAATGVDFAGPLCYKIIQSNGKIRVTRTEKIYIAIFTCAATRAVHLALCKDMTANEFQLALKEFVARRGRPSMIISDNAKTFQATSKWLKYLKQDDGLFNYLGQQNITWRFNLSRAPWWGGFFERLVGIMKRSLSKSVGQSLLTYDEFKETLLDVECFMNDRPLIYVGDECVQPVLTPNLLIRDSPGQFMEEDIDKLNYTDEDVIVTKRMNYLRRTREQLRKRW